MSTEQETKVYEMTGRRPVKVKVAEWPKIAGATDSWHDGQVECQANRTARAWLVVRQNSDGRTLVAGGASTSSAWQGERDTAIKAGFMLPKDDPQAIADKIMEVAGLLRDGCGPIDIDALARECLADLPAEDLGGAS